MGFRCCSSLVRHLDEDGLVFVLEEFRDERGSQVPRGYGNEVPIDCQTISHHQLQGEVCAQRLASLPPGTEGYAGGHERFRDLTACGGCPVPVSCATSALRPSGKRLNEGGGDGGLIRATMCAACGLPAEDVAFHPDGAGHGAASRSGAGVVETWLAAGRRRGACPVPCVSREASTAWREAATCSSTTSAGCIRTYGRVCRPGTVWAPCGN